MNQALLGVYGLSYRYPLRKKKVLQEVSFEISDGEFVTLLGPNGSGKSTILKIIAGILPFPVSGTKGILRYRGSDLTKYGSADRARQLAYVAPEMTVDFPISVEEAVMMGRLCHGHGFFQRISSKDTEVVNWAMEKCLCAELKDRFVQTLSGGELQRVSLARGLAQEAKILLLDEALSKMDLNYQAKMCSMLRDIVLQGYSVVLVAHDLNLASEWADYALLLKEGKTVSYGPVQQMITEDRINSMYPGAGLVVASNPVTGRPKVFFNSNKNPQES